MKQKSWISIVFSFASQCRGRIVLSVLCAIISVVAGLIPYWSVYQIITLFMVGSPVMPEVWKWCWIGLGAYGIRFLLYGISTSLSHISAYTILENIRLALAGRLMKAPLGTVIGESVGKLKSVLVDRVETIELPLAHMIPECISNLLLPVAVFAYLCCIDWRMALAMLVTLPFVLVAFAMMMKDFNRLYADYMESNNYVNGVIVEYVEGIEVIKAFNQSSSSYEKFAKAVQSFKDYTLKWYQSSWKVMNFVSAVLPSTFLGTLPIGMYLYWTGSLAPQDLVMCLILSLGIVGPLMNFTTYAKTELNRDYITAAKVSGCGMWQIIFHHLIPNILPQFLVYFSTGVASAILTVSSFSFLGLGLPSGTAEWGAMLEEAQTALYSHPELLIYPGICILLAAAGFNLFGEALRDILQPQEDVL